MTETQNLPVAPQETMSHRDVVLAQSETDSWVIVVAETAKLAGYIAHTDFVPKGLRGNDAAVTAAILYGRELDMAPMTALQVTHVVNGKVGVSAEIMRGMVLAAGHEISFVESTSAICTMKGRRAGSTEWSSVSWTIDNARQAGLTNKDVWKSYPAQMLRARASTDLCRMIFSDVTHGLASVEEIEDIGPQTASALPAEASQGSSGAKVSRTRKKSGAAKKQTQQAPAPAPAPAQQPQGPPLPGEDGFDEDPTQTGAAGDRGTPPSVAPASADSGGGVVDASAVDGDAAPTTGKTSPESAERDSDVEVPEDPTPAAITRAQMRAVQTAMKDLGVTDRDERLSIVGDLIGRGIDSSNELTRREASTLLDTFRMCGDREALESVMQSTVAARKSSDDGR